MRMLQKTILSVALACLGLLAVAAQAATFSGSSADITDFAHGSEVSTAGAYVSGVNLLNDNVGGVGVSTTINGVLFKGTAPGQFFEGGQSFGSASFVYHGGDGYADSNLWTSGGAYDTLADSQIFNIDNPNTNSGDGAGVINLTPGVRYQLQVLMLDDRAGISKNFPIQFQQTSWTGNFDEISNSIPSTEIGLIGGITIGGNGVTQANGEIATINFTIDSGYNGLLVNPFGSGAINGMQLRTIAIGYGDFNNDGTWSIADIQAMLKALTNLDKYKSSLGLSDSDLFAIGDINFDGVVNNADVQAELNFIASVGGGSITAVPEPSSWIPACAGIVGLVMVISVRRPLV